VGAYLTENPPVRQQWYARRNRPLTGCTVLHDTESAFDEIGEDTGAENVARFIRTRTTPGSYHDLVDSDSDIHLIDYQHGAFHDGTGSNNWALSIAFACRTTDWRRMTPAKRAAMLRRGAAAFKRQQDYRRAIGAPLTELRLITKAQSDAGASGFIYHGWRDPGRRSDPGTIPPNLFPGDEWITACRAALAGITEEDDMPLTDEDLTRIADRVWTRTAAQGGPWAIHMLAGVDAKTGVTEAAVAHLLSAAGQDREALAAALQPIILDAVEQGMAADNADTADQIAARIAAKLAAPTP
jgi:hypothetical protein